MDKKLKALLFISIVVIAICLRWLLLINDNLITYEFYFIDIAKQPISHLLRSIPLFTHEPLFIYILHFWIDIFKISEVAIKFLPLLFGVLLVMAIPLLARLDQELIDERSALATAFLVALSPIHVYFSRQVSPYALFVLLSFLANIFFILFLKKTQLRYALLYFFSMLLTIYTHMSGLVVMLTHFLFVLCVRQKIKKFLFLQGALILSYLPWCIGFLPNQISRYLSAPGVAGAVIYDPPLPTLLTVLHTFLDYSSGSYLLLFLFLFLAGYGLLKVQDRKWAIFLILWMAVPPAIFYLISIFFISVYKFKAIYFVSLPLYILVAKGIMRFKAAMRAGLLLTIALIMCIKLFDPSFYQPQEYLVSLLSAVEKESQPDDTIIVYPWHLRGVVNYYLKRSFYAANNADDIRKTLSANEGSRRFFLVMREQGVGEGAEVLNYLKENYNLLSMREYKSPDRYCWGARLSSYLFNRNAKSP